MNQDLSILHLVLEASVVVQLVMAILLGVSLASWSVIFSKMVGLSRTRERDTAFEQEFWSGRNLNDLYRSASNSTEEKSATLRGAQAAWEDGLRQLGGGKAGWTCA